MLEVLVHFCNGLVECFEPFRHPTLVALPGLGVVQQFLDGRPNQFRYATRSVEWTQIRQAEKILFRYPEINDPRSWIQNGHDNE